MMMAWSSCKMLALTLALAAGFRTQSPRAAPRRSSALSASKRVAVCGPSGGTVADGIAARLAAGGAEVVRVVDGEGRSGRVDAAVCCGDGSDDVALSKLLDACEPTPATVVVVGPGDGGGEEEAGGLRAVLGRVPGFDKGFSDPAAGELQAFKSGLLKEPVLEDDFGRRGARVAVVRDGAKGEDQMFSSGTWLGLGDMAAATERGQMREAQGVAAKPLAATRRGAVADAVVAALASPELKPGLAKFEVRSAAGEKAPSADDWAALLAEVLQAGKSTKALASRLDARYDWAPEPLSSWLCGEWGRRRPSLGALRWETLTNAGVEADGRLEFALVDAGGGLDLVATRDRIDELTGEADLMDLLVDALGKYAATRAAPPRAASRGGRDRRANAASIIELTQGADESEGDAAGTRCGLADLVDDADAAFTAESEPGDRASMWDATTGRPTDAVAALRKRVAARLGALDGSCGARGGELRLRAALALVNSCLVGRSANFKVERTTSDDFADLLGPWFAPGVGAVLLLAVGGFLAAFDALNVLDEARHLQALRHDHIVAYYDTFVHREDGSNGLFALDLRGGAVADYACIAMEDCAGGSLLDHVASGVPFPLPAVVEVTRQCATGLAYAHAQGVVHRDIKLENVFVLRGTIKIGDFGLAVATSASLPNEPPFLGMLLLEDDADRHAAAIAGRFASSLAAAALVEGQKRAETRSDGRARAKAVAGLEALLAALFAVKAADRPRLADVARLGCLGGYASFRLEEFFAFTSLELSPAAGRASTVSKRSRMLRAKSLPRCGGRGADSPAPRARRGDDSPDANTPSRAKSVADGRQSSLSATLRYRATSSPPRRAGTTTGAGFRRRRAAAAARRRRRGQLPVERAVRSVERDDDARAPVGPDDRARQRLEGVRARVPPVAAADGHVRAVDLDGPDPLVQARAPGRLAAHAQRDVDLRVAPQAAVVAHPAVALEHDAGDDEPEVRDVEARPRGDGVEERRDAFLRPHVAAERRARGRRHEDLEGRARGVVGRAGGGDGADVARPHCAAAGAAPRGAAAESSRLFGDRGMGRPGRCAAQKWRPALST
ncbi:kinase kinase kinase [Aureococcus anophagefferens]|nr:kinase kinase kinase [Aureococcus anophagefferens]